MGKRTDSSIPPMTDEKKGKILFESRDKANAFNEAFLSYSKLDTSGADLPDLINYKTNSRLDRINVTEKEVFDIISSLDSSKATGPDLVSAKMLKETSNSVTPSLTRLINLSLHDMVVPQGWKQANVIPLHKKGDRNFFSNYRPISLLNLTSKYVKKWFLSMYLTISVTTILLHFINRVLCLETPRLTN